MIAAAPHASPKSLLCRIYTGNRGGMILRRLCAYYPTAVARDELMLGAGILPRVMGPVAAYASFHWWQERINDDLECLGWQVNHAGREMYRLERLT